MFIEVIVIIGLVFTIIFGGLTLFNGVKLQNDNQIMIFHTANVIQSVEVASTLFEVETGNSPESIHDLVSGGYLQPLYNNISSVDGDISYTEDYYEGSKIISFAKSDLANEEFCTDLSELFSSYEDIVISNCDTEVTQVKFVDPDDIYVSINKD